MFKFITKNFKFLYLFYLTIGVILRFVLWFLYAFDQDDKVTLVKFLASLLLGVINDTVVMLYFIIPIASIFFLCSRNKIENSKIVKKLWQGLSWILIGGILFLFGAEIAFFEEFQSRFNLISVSYLIYPTEVIGNIKQSYPMPLILSVIFVLTSFVWYLFNRKGLISLQVIEEYPLKFKTRLLYSLVAILLVVSVSLVVSHDTFLPTSNRVQAELSSNGISGFFKALKSSDLDYVQLYKIIDSKEAVKITKDLLELDGNQVVEVNQSSNDNKVHKYRLWRNFTPQERVVPSVPNKKNIVFLVQESLGANWLEGFGGRKGLSPYLDKLMAESLVFNNLYASGTRTVRGLEALTISIPPIPSESTVKRPGSDGMRTIGSVLKENGYTPAFLYGGYGAFDNMNQYFESNGFVNSDRLHIDNPKFGNIWGVSDEDLYMHTIKFLDRSLEQNKLQGNKSESSNPLNFLLVMSTSNHKPYTFPTNNEGIPESNGGRDSGVRYADYAIHSFIEEAKKHSWFNETIFVIVADHDARVYGKTTIPIERYKIPMLIYAPGSIQPGRIDTLMSQIDIVPTVLGILGINYQAPFYGQDILTKKYQENKSKRWIPFNYNFDVGLFNEKSLLVLGLNQSIKGFDVEKEDPSKEQSIYKQKKREVTKEEEDLIVSYYQTAYESFKAGRLKE